MAEWGHAGVARSILRTCSTRKPTPYPNWKMGEKLVGSALHYRLYGDRAYVRQDGRRSCALRRRSSDARSDRRARGLLGRERYSSDIPDPVYGLHSQAVAWQGLLAMGSVWAETGDPALARAAARSPAGSRPVCGARSRVSQRRLPDGSLFLPAPAARRRAAVRSRSPRRASGATGTSSCRMRSPRVSSARERRGERRLRYLLRHGSRLLGVVRAGAYALYGDPVFPTGRHRPGVRDQRRALPRRQRRGRPARAEPLRHARGRDDARDVRLGRGGLGDPLDGAPHRAMYLPPNGASERGLPRHAALAARARDPRRARRAARPRARLRDPAAWLRRASGSRSSGVPTSFGAVSYSLEARGQRPGNGRAARNAPATTVKLRLRLPNGQRLAAVTLGDRPFGRIDGQTIDLSGPREGGARRSGAGAASCAGSRSPPRQEGRGEAEDPALRDPLSSARRPPEPGVRAAAGVVPEGQ